MLNILKIDWGDQSVRAVGRIIFLFKEKDQSEFECLRTARGKSLLELWVTTFLPDLQPPLIFVRFISNFLCMCSYSMASAHVILK